ncbi:AAA family ATPase [Sinorhizobium psoraleae]|nr:AAA family ATPase [Sinorhizobium psoraleae]
MARMYIEKLSLTNFRCFGPGATTIDLMPGLTTFIGVNGAGKTAVLQALQRLFE